MGIKYFFSWFNNNFSQTISHDKKSVDCLLMDLNGIFHSAAQQAFEYGNFKGIKPLLNRKKESYNSKKTKFFNLVTSKIDQVITSVQPRTEVVLCIDGVAPMSKQNQQRQRRYKSSLQRPDSFDPNGITPGTKLMDHLSKYIDFWLRDKITNDMYYSNLKFTFSNEKVRGEGEHKLLEYVRRNPDMSYCMHGMDADLIMLGLVSKAKQFYIYRESHTNHEDTFWIDITSFETVLQQYLFWFSSEHDYDKDNAILDFVFICFAVGNDFLPNLPTSEILDGGIEKIFAIYRTLGSEYGHLIKNTEGGVRINRTACSIFFKELGKQEEEYLDRKANTPSKFPYHLLQENSILYSNGTYKVKYDSFKQAYYKKYFGGVSKETICNEYIKGLQWVIEYYTQGVPSWKWYFPYASSPFACDISDYFKNYEHYNFNRTVKENTPFLQLLCVLPPTSKELLPFPLTNIFSLKKYYPDNFEIDYSGKRNEWEGIPLLPTLNLEEIENEYNKLQSSIDQKELKRNYRGRPYVYTHTPQEHQYKSYYGTILSKCLVI
jgi:hypothetical protein